MVGQFDCNNVSVSLDGGFARDSYGNEASQRPRDPIQPCKLIDDIASGQVEDKSDPGLVDSAKDLAAVSLGRRDGLRGGKARAAKMAPERRAEIARNAAAVRWRKNPA